MSKTKSLDEFVEQFRVKPGKNVLAENLAAVFGRPEWDISFYLNTDASTLIGTDTFKNGLRAQNLQVG